MPMTEEQKRAYRKAYQERKREDERIRALIPSPSTLPSAPISNLVPAETQMVAPSQPVVPATVNDLPTADAFQKEMMLANQAEQNRIDARNRQPLAQPPESYYTNELQRLQKGGTVNLTNRPEISTDELKKAKWDAGDGVATVYSSTYTDETGKRARNFTPIIADPETGEYKGVLSEKDLQKYAEDVIAGRRKDDLNLQIGGEYSGDNAIQSAEKDAETIHELHAAMSEQKKKKSSTDSTTKPDQDKYSMPATGAIMSADDFISADEYRAMGNDKEADKLDRMSIDDKLDKWLDPNYQMTDKETKEVKKLAEEQRKKYMSMTAKELDAYTKEHPEEMEQADRIEQADTKASRIGNYASGIKNEFANLASGLADFGIRQSEKNVDKYAGLASAIMGKPEEEVKHAGTEMYDEIRRRKDEAFAPVEEEWKNAQTQNKAMATAGSITGKAMEYAGLSAATGGIAAELGLSPVGTFVADQLVQNGTDAALSWMPEAERMRRDGYSEEEIAKATLQNAAMDAGMNLLGGGISAGIDAWKSARAAKNAIPQLDDIAKMQEYYNNQANPTIERQLLDELNASDSGIKELDLKRNPNGVQNRTYGGYPRKEVNAGRATHIEEIYEGEKPLQEVKNNSRVDIPKSTYDEAQMALIKAGSTEPGKLKSYLGKMYGSLFPKGNPKNVRINGVRFGNKPYKVTIYKKVVNEALHKNATDPEVLSIFNHIEDVVKNADFVDSGKYSAHSGKAKDITRYDYFESPVSINGRDYVCTFDVQIEPSVNNMHKYAVIDEINLVPADEANFRSPSSTLGYADTDLKSAATPSEQGLISDSNIPPESDIVNLKSAGNDTIYSGNDITKAGEVPADEPAEVTKKFSEIIGSDALPNAEKEVPNFTDEVAPGAKVSQVRTNTLQNAGIDTEQELKEIIPEKDFEYIPQAEKETIAQAEDILSTPEAKERAIGRYTADIDQKAAKNMGAVDIDAMMMLRQELNDAARAATDPAEKAALYEQSRRIALNLSKAGRSSGQAIQAFAKWTRTVDGAMTAAEGYAENMVENALKNYHNLGKDIESVSKEINSFLDNMDASAMTREDIEKMIESAVKKRDHLKKRVTKNDIQKLTDAVLNDKQWVDIQNQLEYLATGYNKISPETMDEVQAIFEEAYQLPYNSKQRMKLEQQAFNKLGAEIAPNGGTFGEKFDAWRYLAMLANPSTHIKNMVGNLAFGKGVVSLKNTIAAGIEAAAEKVAKVAGKDFKRTKSILTPADNELVKLARQDGLDNAFRELAGNKYIDVGSAIDEAVPAFNNKGLGKVVNKAADINSKALSGEDEIAGLGKYQTSLAGFLKANGADASIFNATDDASKELLEQARKYAISQAQESTFHQDSRVANALSQFTKNLRNNDNKAAKALGLTIDTIIPFKKTPINILRSTVQYSPVELFKVLTDIPKVKKGVMSGAEMIDDIAKTATGTGMLGIGALLAHNGIITSGFTDSDEKTNFDRTTGRQGIAVHINIPGMQPFTVSLSELSPASMPLIFGAAVYESKAKKDVDDSALDVIINGLSASVNAITDMTMLSGISDLLSNIRYAESDADVIKKIGSHVVGNLAGQMIPSVGGRIEKVIDENKRSTYATNSGTLGEIERVGRQAANKIPFLNPIADSMTGSDNEKIASLGDAIRNQISVDAWGREMKQPGINAAGRAILSLASPVSIQADRSDELDRALYDLEERSGLPAYPKTTQSEGNIDDKRLTGDQFTEYAKYKGQLSRELAEQLILSGDYDDTNDETKAGALNTIYGFAKAMAQDNAVGKEMSNTNAKLKEIYETDGAKGVADYIVRGNETKAIAQNAGIKNYDAVKKAYDEGGATLAEQTANTIATLQDADLKPSAYYAYDHAKSVLPGLDDQTFINTYKAINTDWTKGNTSISAKEMEAYLNRIKATYEQGRQIASAYYTGGDGTWNLVDGEWKYKKASK